MPTIRSKLAGKHRLHACALGLLRAGACGMHTSLTLGRAVDVTIAGALALTSVTWFASAAFAQSSPPNDVAAPPADVITQLDALKAETRLHAGRVGEVAGRSIFSDRWRAGVLDRRIRPGRDRSASHLQNVGTRRRVQEERLLRQRPGLPPLAERLSAPTARCRSRRRSSLCSRLESVWAIRQPVRPAAASNGISCRPSDCGSPVN